MRNISWITGALAAAIALAGCAQPAPLTAAEDRQVDEAMAKVEIEQARTDASELEKRRKASKADNHSTQAGRVFAPQVRPVEPRQHFPPAAVISSPDQSSTDVRRSPSEDT